MAMKRPSKPNVLMVCSHGKERSRITGEAINERAKRDIAVARGSLGLDGDPKALEKFGWKPSDGFVRLLKDARFNLPTYESKLLSKEEAEYARIIIAISPVVARRITTAFPELTKKVVLALKVMGYDKSPFYKYLGPYMPDAQSGHLSSKVRHIFVTTRTVKERIEKVKELLKVKELSPQVLEFVKNWNGDYKYMRDNQESTSTGNKKVLVDFDPTDNKVIPAELREYMGNEIDSDAAYVKEVHLLRMVAKVLQDKGYYK
jgi:protein-tyrosine-phosphatase